MPQPKLFQRPGFVFVLYCLQHPKPYSNDVLVCAMDVFISLHNKSSTVFDD